MARCSNHSNPWTNARLAYLKERWADGAFASEIANGLGGGITKNAVIGKARRLGLAERQPGYGGGVTKVRKAKPAPAPAKPSRLVAKAFPQLVKTPKSHKAPRAVPDVRPIAPDPGPGIVRFLDRSSKQCAWPKWSGSTPLDEKMCCGQPIEEGRSGQYCAHHVRLNTGLGTISERTALRSARSVVKAEAA